ncbi:glycosyl hydrolase [Asanoa sp. NPDC049573]|uniref:glycoside hydrolase family 26 protein n=1 Tax=Asanoa sp. NPDC049573 TaxID=3155396 RepID=UPI0034367F14
MSALVLRRLAVAAALTVAAALPMAACTSTSPTGSAAGAGQPGVGAAEPTAAPEKPVVAKVDDVLGDHPLFGVMLADRSKKAVDAIEKSVDCRPELIKVFASVEDGISAKTLNDVPGTPVLSIEPWSTGGGEEQPDWTLASTIDSKWDDQYAAIARAVIAYRKPILVRFAHEMNGHWYPWGTANGNRKGEYVKAWKHVVGLFRDMGASNALWVWSPNVIRGADSKTIKEFWPGGNYVDVVGLTGYGVRETTPVKTYHDTLKLVYTLTDKPIVLTEVGVQPGPEKRAWLKAFGPWLKDTPRIAGFVWNQVNRDGEWSFDDTDANVAAFRSSLARSGVAC